MGPIIRLVMLSLGIVLIILVHRELPREHGQPKKVTKLATQGIYSKIRHPVYSGFIFINFGLSLIFINYIMLTLSIILIPIWYIVSIYEEKFLIKKFREEYLQYKKRVKWRFILKIF
ncbi:MAG: isoprenylcysteine carboxylmethyltransferase family protein [archaeon GB-1867-035]|nr:isoprenylcysteine carboxylmethyltransferase family protein [Candidatus Culexmicrobium profundum]